MYVCLTLLEHSQGFGLMSSLVASRHNNPHNCQDPVVSNRFCVINYNYYVPSMETLIFHCSLLTYQQGAPIAAKRMKTLKVAQIWPHREMC